MSIETFVDGAGPAVVVIPSYRRDGGEDFEPFNAAVVTGSLMGAALAAGLIWESVLSSGQGEAAAATVVVAAASLTG